jgi:23S rRNA (uracil1939-C5)-methyltransferase
MTLPQPHNSFCQFFPACGGCDFLDLKESDYQKLKQELLNKITATKAEWIWVKHDSRRKIIFQITNQNELGFFSKKTNKIVTITSCFVAEKAISDLILELKKFLKNQQQNFFNKLSITLFDNGLDLVFFTKESPDLTQTNKLIEFAKKENLNISYKTNKDVVPVFITRKNQIFYPDFKIDLSSEIFIQATKLGLEAIIKICRNEILQLEKNLKIADLYSGFGAYSFGICNLASKISAFEGDSQMTILTSHNANKNNLKNISAKTRDLFFDPLNKKELNEFDLVIINPPRNGASPQIIEISKSNLKNLIYVSCNPQSFFHDFAILQKNGFEIKKLYALDQFYATKHLEIIAIIKKI